MKKITDELRNSRIYQELLREMYEASKSEIKMKEIERIRAKVSAIKKRPVSRKLNIKLVINKGVTRCTL